MSSEVDQLPAVPADGARLLPMLRRALLPVALLLSIVLGAQLLVEHPRGAMMDQAHLLGSRFEREHMPSPALGFTSQLIVALQLAVTPLRSVAPNEQVQVLALVFYLVAAALLAQALLKRVELQLLLLALLVSSQFPFLWLSTELFVGAFLCLVLWSFATQRPPWATGGLAALLALCKPDLILLAGVLIVVMALSRQERRERLVLGGSFAAGVALLLAPGLLLVGFGYLHTGEGASGGRSLLSFQQHFAALVAGLQVVGRGPNPWTEPGFYFRPFFGDARSMAEVVVSQPYVYLSFVALSLVRGVFRAGWVLGYALFAIPLLWWAHRRLALPRGTVERVLLWSFVGVVPFVLFAYPHVRYFARYYPIAMLLLLMGLERLIGAPRGSTRTAALAGVGTSLACALILNLQRFAASLHALPELDRFWFPD